MTEVSHWHDVSNGPFENVSLRLETRIQLNNEPGEPEFYQVWGIYPSTVVQARYGGSYEGSPWLAFPCYSDQIDQLCRGWDSSDVECLEFWLEANREGWSIGHGSNPSEAHENLVAQLKLRAGVVDGNYTNRD